jgi:hypothetical protein
LPIHRLELRKAKGNDQKNFQGESMANWNLPKETIYKIAEP